MNKKIYSFVPIPGTTQHKRPRRRYEEIERMYRCGWQNCDKAYGTLNHLNAHVTMQSHGKKRTPDGKTRPLCLGHDYGGLMLTRAVEFKEIRQQWKARKKALAERQRELEEQHRLTAEAAAAVAAGEQHPHHLAHPHAHPDAHTHAHEYGLRYPADDVVQNGHGHPHPDPYGHGNGHPHHHPHQPHPDHVDSHQGQVQAPQMHPSQLQTPPIHPPYTLPPIDQQGQGPTQYSLPPIDQQGQGQGPTQYLLPPIDRQGQNQGPTQYSLPPLPPQHPQHPQHPQPLDGHGQMYSPYGQPPPNHQPQPM